MTYFKIEKSGHQPDRVSGPSTGTISATAATFEAIVDAVNEMMSDVITEGHQIVGVTHACDPGAGDAKFSAIVAILDPGD